LGMGFHFKYADKNLSKQLKNTTEHNAPFNKSY
jgi:hypothetical protein